MPGFQGEKFPDFSTEVIYEAPIDALGAPTSYCICLPALLSNHSKHIVKNLTRRHVLM